MFRRLLRVTLAALVAFGVGGATLTGQQAPASPASPPATASQTAPVASPSPQASPLHGTFSFGTSLMDAKGDLTRAGEFDVVRDTALPRLGAQLWGTRGNVRFDLLASHGGDGRDQSYYADLDLGGHVRARVRYDRFQHRLDHDPLTYMDAAVATFVVRHTDTDPAAAYSTGNGELDARLEATIPGLESVRFFLGHRRQARDGHHQSLTTSHCANCHTVSYTKRTSERTRDLSAGSRLQLAHLTLDYTFQNRRFEDSAETLRHTYDNAVQPQTLQDVFLNRVSYDDANGPLNFDQAPRIRKNSHVLKARVGLPGDVALIGNFSTSEVRNLDTLLDTSYTGGGGRIVVPLGRRAVLKAALRHYQLDSDPVLVDVPEPVAPAGPSAGLTYAQAYPGLGTVDFVRESSLSRSPTDFTMDFSYRPSRLATFNLGFAHEALERKHFEVAKTTTDTVKLSGRGRAGKVLSWQVRFQNDWVQDPFRYVSAAVPAALQLAPSPGGLPFTGLQYFDMYRSRQADLTSFPTRATMLEERVTWSPSARLSLSGHYRWRNASNDDLTLSRWHQNAHLPGVELWLAPHDRVTLTAGYSFQRERLETLFSTLAFVG